MMVPHIHTLDNGLTVILVEQPGTPVATFWVWYRVGSRNEVPGSTGISHWVEHMLFKGTPTHPKGALTRYIDRLGGRWNAFTWKDYTAYHEVLPAEHLGVAITLEADRMANTIMDPAEVDSERTVIISEREGSENFPAYLLREEVDAAAHKVHPYRIPVIGWKDDLRAITRDDLYRHYRNYYHPNNAVAVAVGAFDTDVVLEQIRDAFADLPPGPIPPGVRVTEPPQEGERRVVLERPGGGTAYLHIVYHVPGAVHPDLPALLVADGVLSGFKSIVPFDGAGGGRSSRLYRALVETGLASDVTSSLIPSVDPTLFRIMATVRSGQDIAAVEERALAEVERLVREPVERAELEKVKKQARAQFVFSRDGVYRVALGFGAFAITDRPEAFQTLVDRITEVTPDDVMRAAGLYFTPRRRTVGWYVPQAPDPRPQPAPSPSTELRAGAAEGTLDPVSSSAAYRPGVFGFTQPPRALSTVLPITPDVVMRTTLDNGMTVLARQMPGTGMIAAAGFVKAGGMFDGGRFGLARIVAAMLQRGTQTRSSQEIAEALDGMGAGLTIQAGLETVGIGLRALSEDAPAALGILGDVLMRPVFPADELEKLRGEVLTALRVGLQDTRLVAERAFRRLLYPAGHPHRELPDGDVDAVATITRDEVAAFHRARSRPEATVLVIVGDLPPAGAVDTAARVFGAWPRGGAWALPPVPPLPRLTAPARGAQRLAGKVQSDIVLGAPGIARGDSAFYATMVANLILGQLGLMGRLGDRVREREGMAYYAFSDLRAGLLAGPWLVRAGVNPANEDRAVAGILAEIQRFQEQGPEADELNDARDFLIGSLAVRLETNSGIAQTLAEIELFDLGLDYIARYPQIIRGITHAEIVDAAREFPAEAYALAVAGPPRNE